MKNRIQFCRSCRTATEHRRWSECQVVGKSLAGRVFLGFASGLVSEMLRDSYCECLSCGRRSKDA